MSASERFFDTNILLHLADGNRAAAAEDILSDGGVISVQVLNEFAAVARRKWRFDWRETREFLDTFREAFDVVPLTVETHERGIAIAERYQLSVYDGFIVAAAQLAGCRMLYSEDMHDGLVIDGLTIRNPFAGG